MEGLEEKTTQCRRMINKPPPFKDFNIRIPIITPMKGIRVYIMSLLFSESQGAQGVKIPFESLPPIAGYCINIQTYELQSSLLKVGSIGDYIREFYRGY